MYHNFSISLQKFRNCSIESCSLQNGDSSAAKPRTGRSSRWDTGGTKGEGGAGGAGAPGAGPPVAALPPPGLAVPGLGRPPGVLPDMSKPPPGFMGAAVSVTPFDHLSYLKPFELCIHVFKPVEYFNHSNP